MIFYHETFDRIYTLIYYLVSIHITPNTPLTMNTPIGPSLSAPIGILTADLLLAHPSNASHRTVILGSVRWKLRCNLHAPTLPNQRGGRAYRRRLAIQADLGYCRKSFTYYFLP